jgi:arylsulfatase A-like enzyme/Flp pilus assembly protein TadD
LKHVCPVVLLIAAVALACDRAAPAPEPASRHNIVLVTIDTLRADRVGRGITPTLDRLAESGARFTNARTTVPLTLPAHVSLMTGTPPPVHGVRENGVPFSNGVPTLAKIFRAAGYRTGAFVGAYVLDRRFGLADGFETYDDRIKRDPDAAAKLEAERRASEVVDAAGGWLDSSQAPFLLWVHLYDPHAPYDPPAEYRDGSASLYDGEVRYADAQVARLLQHIPRGLLDRTVIVVAGDHGEGLGEHGEATHGMLAYDSTLRVPLIVSAPGLEARQIAAPVSLADVAPAVLRLAGVNGTLADNPLRRDLLDGKPGDLYAETRYPQAAGWHPLTALAGEQWKLIASSERELYDIKADSQESRNLAADHPNIVDGMSSLIAKIAATASSGNPSGTVSAEAAARLRALGYVGGGSSSAVVDPNAPNPAKVIESWTQFEKALSLMNAGRATDAVAAVKTLAARYPSGLVFQTSYARALQDSGRSPEALNVLRAAVKRWPADATLFHDLAVAARAAGDRSEAMKAEQAALALDKASPAALNGLGLLHADAGRPAEAATAFEQAAQADPSNASYWSNLGNARRELGDVSGAQAAYRRALEADPRYADAANGLGVLLVQSGKPSEAVTWFEKALESSPDFHEARLNLGIAYQESGKRAEAAAAYQEVLKRAPARFARERKAASELLRGLK